MKCNKVRTAIHKKLSPGDQFIGKDGKPITKYFREDKLHYNVEGYKVWGKNIRERVNEISNLKL